MSNKYLLTVVSIVALLVVGLFGLAIRQQGAASTPGGGTPTVVAARPSDKPAPVPTHTSAATPTPSPTATATINADVEKTATAEAQAAEAEIAAQDATAAAQVSEAALAEAGTAAAVEVTETAMVVEATATVQAGLTKTAVAIVEATAEVGASATADAIKATQTARAQPTARPTTVPPAPLPDAVVNAPDGFARLWSGPGTETYDSSVLPNGTKLDVLRSVVNKPDWLKVAANGDSAEPVEGYVNIASGLIRINVNQETLIPIYEYGPKPVTPKPYETRGLDGLIEFSWEPVGLPLEEGQVYSVILVRDDLTDAEACYHWQTTDTKISVKPEDFGCTAGDYHWGVGLATSRGQAEDGNIIWRDDSQRDERSPVGIGVPHSGKPQNTNDGDGGGNSGGGGGVPGG